MITVVMRIYLLICMAWCLADPLAVNVQSTGHAKMPLLIALMSDQDNLPLIAEIIKKDFEYRGQFAVDIKQVPGIVNKHDVKEVYKQGYQLALYLNCSEQKDIEWRLYSTAHAHMISGKKYKKRGDQLRAWAHHVSDAVWPLMTSMPGFFSTKIAYCKEVPLANGHSYKHIYLADYDGSNPIPLVTSPTISVAPRWNRDPEQPLIFYSECTKSNIRLMAMDMKKRRKVVSNFDGLNMLPSFSADGKKVVYCASRGDGSCQIYYYEQGVFKRLTQNTGNNISPVFSADASKIYYCSDFQTGSPQIYCYDLASKMLERLTESGYCASPAYCGTNNTLAYTKLIKGVNQVFTLDLNTKEHKQITFDGANKEECSWSVCGSYLLYSVQDGSHSRIAQHDLITQERRFLTDANQRCSYPCWSGSYADFPVLT